jgi:hypothetical protein
MKQVTCNNCGWVHFAVTREYAENQTEDFNKYFDSLSVEDRNKYYSGRKSTIRSYEHCFRCDNPYTDFSPAEEGDCPDGCTIQPIIQD